MPKQSNLRSASLADISGATKVLSLDKTAFSTQIKSFSAAKSVSKIVYLPDGEGVIVPFNLKETSVLHPDLAKNIPTKNPKPG